MSSTKISLGKALWGNTKSVTLFIQAARQGNVKVVRQCLADGVNPNTVFDGTTIVHTCVEMEHRVMFLAVIEKAQYLNLNIQTDFGDTALMLACKKRINLPIIIMLLKFGADPNVPNKNNRVPLHAAVLHKSIILVQKLLKHDADINIMDVFGHTPLSMAVVSTRFLPMVKILVKNMADVNISRGLERSYFLDLCISCSDRNDLDLVQYLLDNGVNLQVEDPISRNNAYHCAVSCNNPKLTTLLMDYEIDIQHVNAAGMTPLQLAKHFRFREVTVVLEKRINDMLADHAEVKAKTPSHWRQIMSMSRFSSIGSHAKSTRKK